MAVGRGLSGVGRDLSEERRRRLVHRALPAAGALLLLVLVIALVASLGASDQVSGARRFLSAWERGDYAAMHAQLTDDAKRRYPRTVFDAAYRAAAATETAVRVDAGDAHDSGGGARASVAFRTRVFGRLRGKLDLPMATT